MKTIYKLILIFIIVACKSINYIESSDPPPCLGVLHSTDKEYIFFNKIKVDTSTCKYSSYGYPLKDLDGYRKGYFKNGKQNGKWISDRYYHYDSLGYSRSKKYLAREEYFKNGLRDSIYKIYDKDGKIIYSSHFKNGNGIEKDFYNNGQLYYEITTQNGYFTDTLRLFHDNGRLAAKLFFKRDSLLFKEYYSRDIADTIENNRKVKIFYSGRKIEKKQFKNETWWYDNNGHVELKAKDSLVNGVKKSFQEYIKDNTITKSIRIDNNPNIEYEKIERWRDGKLSSELVVFTNNKVPYEIENFYDKNGKLEAKVSREHKAYLHIKPNYRYEKTIYYEDNRKKNWSELIYIDIKEEKQDNDKKRISLLEKNYYNNKNKLIKKEYITQEEGSITKGGGCQAIVKEPYLNRKITKTEDY